jgi:hypothetical protein
MQDPAKSQGLRRIFSPGLPRPFSARPHRAVAAAQSRRRGDRITVLFAARAIRIGLRGNSSQGRAPGRLSFPCLCRKLHPVMISDLSGKFPSS